MDELTHSGRGATRNSTDQSRKTLDISNRPCGTRKACGEPISSRVTSSVICRRRSGCGKIIRCAPCGPWWTKCSSSCRDGLSDVCQGRASVDSAGKTVASADAADAVLDS